MCWYKTLQVAIFLMFAVLFLSRYHSQLFIVNLFFLGSYKRDNEPKTNNKSFNNNNFELPVQN